MKKKKEKEKERERKRNEKIKLDKIYRDAERTWNYLSKVFEDFDDGCLAKGVILKVRENGYCVGSNVELFALPFGLEYIDQTLDKVMNLAEEDGIKTAKFSGEKSWIFEYNPGI